MGLFTISSSLSNCRVESLYNDSSIPVSAGTPLDPVTEQSLMRRHSAAHSLESPQLRELYG
eukprot:1551640-Amphidinium_carterae.1